MSSDLQIRFQLGAQSHIVDFREQDNSRSKNSILIGGISYSLRGNEEALSFVKDCFAQIPKDSTETLKQAGKELKARLWLASAKEIKLSTTEGAHKIGVKILEDVESLDLHKMEIYLTKTILLDKTYHIDRFIINKLSLGNNQNK